MRTIPLLHLRVCSEPCNRVRFAPCGRACQLPVDTDPDNWRTNLQEGAGTIGRPTKAGMVIIPPNPDAEPGEWNPFDGRAEAAGFVHVGAMTE